MMSTQPPIVKDFTPLSVLSPEQRYERRLQQWRERAQNLRSRRVGLAEYDKERVRFWAMMSALDGQSYAQELPQPARRDRFFGTVGFWIMLIIGACCLGVVVADVLRGGERVHFEQVQAERELTREMTRAGR